ncbi:MAG: LrgB family protein [Endomicrobiaceae bacterium]|nr:LrgB family protein [Endomicrobiaceae bacterium]
MENIIIKILILISTILIYKLTTKIKHIKYMSIIPPVILCAIIIYALNILLKIDYNTYNNGGKVLTFLLGPAIIAFSLPLIKNLKVLQKNYSVILIGVCISTIFAILSVVCVALVLKANTNIMLSIVPKAVTTPVAIEISKVLGGKPEITILLTIFSGMFGAIFGHWILKGINVTNNLAIGVAIGSVSHVLGTAKCYDENSLQAAVSTITLVLSCVTTAIIAPLIIKIIF